MPWQGVDCFNHGLARFFFRGRAHIWPVLKVAERGRTLTQREMPQLGALAARLQQAKLQMATETLEDILEAASHDFILPSGPRFSAWIFG